MECPNLGIIAIAQNNSLHIEQRILLVKLLKTITFDQKL